ncbi:MAG: hypothetical protein ACYC3X_05700 [Pirellulaceae bacterium]
MTQMPQPSPPPSPAPVGVPPGSDTPDWGWLLTVWMSLVVILNGLIWTTGVPDYDLADAVERGAARVEDRSVGEENEDVVRKSIQLQRGSLSFWKVITLVGDFLVEPLWIGLRAFLVAVALSAVAAISGRPVRFPAAMWECVAWQGVWVLGLAVHVVLMVALNRSEINTSVVLLLPPRMYAAREWVALQQIDLFALLGWLGMAWGACRRGQTGLLTAVLTCLMVAVAEAPIIAGTTLLIKLSMRLTLFPE